MQAFPPVNLFPEIPVLADDERATEDVDGVDSANPNIFALLLSNFEAAQTTAAAAASETQLNAEDDNPRPLEGIDGTASTNRLSESFRQSQARVGNNEGGLESDFPPPETQSNGPGAAFSPDSLLGQLSNQTADQFGASFNSEIANLGGSSSNLSGDALANAANGPQQSTPQRFELPGPSNNQPTGLGPSASRIEDSLRGSNFSQNQTSVVPPTVETPPSGNQQSQFSVPQQNVTSPEIISSAEASVQATPLLSNDAEISNGLSVEPNEANFGQVTPPGLSENQPPESTDFDQNSVLEASTDSRELRLVDNVAGNELYAEPNSQATSAASPTTFSQAQANRLQQVSPGASEGSVESDVNTQLPNEESVDSSADLTAGVETVSTAGQSGDESPSFGELAKNQIDKANTTQAPLAQGVPEYTRRNNNVDETTAERAVESDSEVATSVESLTVAKPRAKFGVQRKFARELSLAAESLGSTSKRRFTQQRTATTADRYDSPSVTQTTGQQVTGETSGLPLAQVSNRATVSNASNPVSAAPETPATQLIHTIIDELVADSSSSLEEKTLTIRFEDPHIGSVRLEMTETDSGMSVSIAAGDELTLEMLNANSQQFERSLKDHEIELLEIVGLQAQTSDSDQHQTDQMFQREMSQSYRNAGTSNTRQTEDSRIAQPSESSLDFRA